MEKRKDIMKENVEEQAGLRAYLLGILGDKEKMQQIEEKILLDDGFADSVSVAEDKLIEDFLDNDLSKEHREDFIRFFLSTPERRRQFRLVKNVRRSARTRLGIRIDRASLWSRLAAMFSSPVPALAGAACLILVAGFVWVMFVQRSDNQMVTQLLNGAFKDGRPFETRISGLNYAPYKVTRGDKPSPSNQAELNAAERIWADSVLKGETPATLQNAGRISLVKGEIDQAVAQFEKASMLDPANAETLNDLGTAYLEKSRSFSKDKKGERLELSSKALEDFEKALKLNPGLLPALFNKALCLQQMDLLPSEAQKAWEEYLKADPSSPWAEEAKQHIRELSENPLQSKKAAEILEDFLSAYEKKDDDKAHQIASKTREMITGKLIFQQLAFLFLTAPEAERNKYLSALEYLGKLEKDRSGDPYIRDIAEYYSSSGKEKREDLSRAYAAIHEGYNSCLTDDCKDAIDSFTEARAIFTEAGDVWEARLCDYWRGYVLYNLGKISESTEVLDDLDSYGQSKNYKWLAAQASSWLAVNMAASRDLSKAIAHDKKTLSLAGETSDLYLLEKASSHMGDMYRRMGNYPQALAHIHRALELGREPEASERQRVRDYETVADMFLSMKSYYTALAYKNESVSVAAHSGERTFLFTAYSSLGSIYGLQERFPESFAAFDKSVEVAEKLPNKKRRERAMALAKLYRAHVLRQSNDCSAALKNYDEALDFFETSEYQALSYDAHKGKLLCLYENNDENGFRAELPQILHLFNEYRDKIKEDQNRDSFFSNEQNVYDIAIDHEFVRANYIDAFNYSEESRARTLLDLQRSRPKISGEDDTPEITLLSQTAEPLKLGDIQAGIPDGVQILQYSVLDKKTLIWLIAKDSFEVVATDITASDLYDKTVSYVELIKKNDDWSKGMRREIGRELYSRLISPVESRLIPNKRICIIPDKILFRLPFSTLTSPADGNYFVAKHTFLISPSANIFLACSTRANELGRDAAESLISIGNPELDKNVPELESLDDLEAAEKEANEIARFYPQKVVLTREAAVKNKVKEEMSKANVIHFAGHYLVNASQPLLSGFVLAGDSKTSGLKGLLLANDEIFAEKLLHAKLIVLSACQTGVEKIYDGEGMIGSSRAFLASGVPLVVASQWDVDSAASAELMTAFHRYRKQEGLPTIEALRHAQLDMLNGPSSLYREPYYWAAFETIGGYAEF